MMLLRPLASLNCATPSSAPVHVRQRHEIALSGRTSTDTTHKRHSRLSGSSTEISEKDVLNLGLDAQASSAW